MEKPIISKLLVNNYLQKITNILKLYFKPQHYGFILGHSYINDKQISIIEDVFYSDNSDNKIQEFENE